MVAAIVQECIHISSMFAALKMYASFLLFPMQQQIYIQPNLYPQLIKDFYPLKLLLPKLLPVGIRGIHDLATLCGLHGASSALFPPTPLFYSWPKLKKPLNSP